MPNEAWSASPIPPHKSLEALKQTFKQRLDGILHKQLTVDNVETFADEALIETVKLDAEILKEYGRNPNFHASPSTLNTQEQENEAFKILELPDIQEILTSINAVKEKIDTLKTYLKTGIEKTDTVITPPQETTGTPVQEGVGNFAEKRMFLRLLTLMYILERDFELPPSAIKITEGKVAPGMIRKTPYIRVEIPDLKRAVYICDEEGNVSYVFDTVKLAEKELTLAEIDVDDKGDKNSLVSYHPGVGIRILQTKNWRERMKRILKEPIPEIQTKVAEEHQEEERARISEFREFRRNYEWPSFEEFQEEVRKFYSGVGAIED